MARAMILGLRSSHATRLAFGQLVHRARAVSTLAGNPHIYVHTDAATSTHTLTLTPTTPPVASLALGTTASLPPAPATFRENTAFHAILHAVLAAHAVHDPAVRSQAVAYASQVGSVGRTGAGRGGWVHVSDQRNPPDYGRIAWPDDIFGSVEVDASGHFVAANGNYQPSGTYRMCTNEGVLGLSPYLRDRLVERLRALEDKE